MLPSHPDFPVVSHVANAIVRAAGGSILFSAQIKSLLRNALDEVIDAPRTSRFTLDEIEKTEKTYIGTKVENLVRSWLGFPRGHLDMQVDGFEVDIKNTISSTWTIPPEAIGHPCLLIRCDEVRALCWVGVILITQDKLNIGLNRDRKTTIQAAIARESTLWLVNGEPYPPNFWLHVAPDARRHIMEPRGGTERLARLFRAIQRIPISRVLVQSVAQQDDYMKRIRRNGGARDLLAPERIAILWGQKDRGLIEFCGLPEVGADSFISVMPQTQEQYQVLREAGHID